MRCKVFLKHSQCPYYPNIVFTQDNELPYTNIIHILIRVYYLLREKEYSSRYISNASTLSKDHLFSCELMNCSHSCLMDNFDAWETKPWKGIFVKWNICGIQEELSSAVGFGVHCPSLQNWQKCWCTHTQLSEPGICLFGYHLDLHWFNECILKINIVFSFLDAHHYEVANTLWEERLKKNNKVTKMELEQNVGV